jgi:hypothetical protein
MMGYDRIQMTLPFNFANNFKVNDNPVDTAIFRYGRDFIIIGDIH